MGVGEVFEVDEALIGKPSVEETGEPVEVRYF